MENRTWKLASGLVLALFALSLGGCQLLGSEKSSEANDSASNAPVNENVISAETIETPAEAVPKESPKQPEVVAAVPLTIPTDPDARVKAVRKGRSNPFATLVAPKPKNAEPVSNSGRSNAARTGPFGSRPALGGNRSSSRPAPAPKPASALKPAPAKNRGLPRLSNPTQNNDIVLPPLPEPTLAKQVSVQGIVTLGAQPQAILKAPNESVARTVTVGDYLSDGQILVSAIDTSNPQSPKVVLVEAGQTVTVSVGKPAESASAAPDAGSLSASLPF